MFIVLNPEFSLNQSQNNIVLIFLKKNNIILDKKKLNKP